MRILYDHQIFSQQDYGGISRYFFQTCSRLNSHPDVEIQGSLLFSNNEYLSGNNLFASHPFLKSINFRGRRKTYSFLNKLYSTFSLRNSQFDIFHPTYYDPYYLELVKGKPVVLTCYDLIHEKFLRNNKAFIKSKRETLYRATSIIAISESTKNDLIEIYRIDPLKIKVIHLASSLSLTGAQKVLVDGTTDRYFLYVGLRNEYKNFLRCVDALAPLLANQSDLFFYCAGGGAFNNQELGYFKNLKILNKVKLHRGDDETLKKLYAGAIAFFYPSLYEGFGIPLLEAMDCGCPIATSNTSSLPEIAGEAAIYFDPYNVNSIRFAAESFLVDDKMRSLLIEKGIIQKSKFSWDNTAFSTYDLYNSLV